MAFVKTNGIAISSIKFGDHDLIVRIYTESHGLLAFLIKGARKQRSKRKAAYFQPLNLLKLEISYKESKSLHGIRELAIDQPLSSIHTNIRKSSITLFLSEMLQRCIQEEEQNTALFDFLKLSVLFLDQMEKGISNFHPVFLFQLCAYLGIKPSANKGELPYFNLEDGTYSGKTLFTDHLLNEEQSVVFHKASCLSYQEIKMLQMRQDERKDLLNNILSYYRLHLPEMGSVKTLKVLEAVFE